jgi:hypothetical protein
MLPLRHQEPGVCVIGTKIFLVGGTNGTLADYQHDLATIGEKRAIQKILTTANGHTQVSIYDMTDRTITAGPDFPFGTQHVSCAVAPDGVTIYMAGGYIVSGESNKYKASHIQHYSLNTSNMTQQGWIKRADMPTHRGGHGCAFLADGKMYCVGGATAQNGPFTRDLIIYDPIQDAWEFGPPMNHPRDHLMTSTLALFGGTKLYVAGGRSHTTERDAHATHPYHFSNSDVVEMFDLQTQTWERKTDIMMARAAIAVVPYYRYGADHEPNLLLIGGEQFFGWTAKVDRIVEEYDPIHDVYNCLEHLPHPVFGCGVGVYKDELHIVGGADWAGLTATKRVQIYDLQKAPGPMGCFYDPIPVFDQFDRVWNKALPFPDFRRRCGTTHPGGLKETGDCIMIH